MDIMKMFGRVFPVGNPENSLKDVPKPTEKLSPTETSPNGMVTPTSNSNVMLRRSRSQVNVEERKSNRISVADFSFETIEEKHFVDEESIQPEEIQGYDWESVDYGVDTMKCEDEVTALAVSDKYLVLQYYIDPGIDVFDRATKTLLFKLEGHSYGGQCLQISPDDNVLYSGSMDKAVISWDLNDHGRMIEKIFNHVDYVQCLALKPRKWLASGGKGDKKIFVYETDDKGKLWKRFSFEGHDGWVTQLVFMDDYLVSGSEDASIRIWDLTRGTLFRVFRQDESITCLSVAGPDLLLFGDKSGKLSYLDLESRTTIHLLPNILIGTGRYCRSSKYHDKAVDVLFVTGNGYIITCSSGSKFIKIWRIQHNKDPTFHEDTEVTELQILRDHTDFLTTFQVYEGTIYSSSSDGFIYTHSFLKGQPHYEMAQEQENNSSVLWNQGIASPEKPTAVCEGPRLCRVGKTGLVRSSSSFQVKIQLQPKVCSVGTRIRLPRMPSIVHEEEGSSDEDDSESGCEVILETSEEDDVSSVEDESNSEEEESSEYETDDEDEDSEEEDDIKENVPRKV